MPSPALNQHRTHAFRTLQRAASAAILTAAAAQPASASAQADALELSPGSGWTQARTPEQDIDRLIINAARTLIADGKPGRAKDVLDDWLDRNENTRHPLEPEALRLRGDAKLADGNEFAALFDYEQVIRLFPESSEFVTAIEREVDIAQDYLGGLKKKFLGLPLRIEASRPTAEEILVRAQERMPGSRLAERSAIMLADYYYRVRELDLAAEMYEIFLLNFPVSEHRRRAARNRIYASIASFKGPEYDGLALLESKLQIQQYAREYPADAQRAFLNDALIARIDESAATQQLRAAEWYLTNDDDPAAAYTLRRLLRDQPGTIAAARALQILETNGWLLPTDASDGQPR
ncbi:MAG: outer membrane protein assembly factor BamD [Planctomycetota bacterium]